MGGLEQLALPSGASDETLFVERLKLSLAANPPQRGRQFRSLYTMKITRERHGKLLAAVDKHEITITDVFIQYIDAVLPVLESALPIAVDGHKRDRRTTPRRAASNREPAPSGPEDMAKAEQMRLPSEDSAETLYVKRLKETLAAHPAERGNKFSFTTNIRRARHDRLKAALNRHGMTITDLLTLYVDAVLPVLQRARPVEVPSYTEMRARMIRLEYIPRRASLRPAGPEMQ